MRIPLRRNAARRAIACAPHAESLLRRGWPGRRKPARGASQGGRAPPTLRPFPFSGPRQIGIGSESDPRLIRVGSGSDPACLARAGRKTGRCGSEERLRTCGPSSPQSCGSSSPQSRSRNREDLRNREDVAVSSGSDWGLAGRLRGFGWKAAAERAGGAAGRRGLWGSAPMGFNGRGPWEALCRRGPRRPSRLGQGPRRQGPRRHDE